MSNRYQNGEYQCLISGSYHDDAEYCRSCSHILWETWARHTDISFRLVSQKQEKHHERTIQNTTCCI